MSLFTNGPWTTDPNKYPSCPPLKTINYKITMDQLGSHHILSSVPPAQLLQRREQLRSSTLPPVLPTGQEYGQQVEGEKYAQAKEHPTNIGLSYGEGNRKVRSENTAIPPMLPLDAQGPLIWLLLS